MKSRLTRLTSTAAINALPDYLKGIAHVIVNDDWAQTTQSLDALVAQVAPGWYNQASFKNVIITKKVG